MAVQSDGAITGLATAQSNLVAIGTIGRGMLVVLRLSLWDGALGNVCRIKLLNAQRVIVSGSWACSCLMSETGSGGHLFLLPTQLLDAEPTALEGEPIDELPLAVLELSPQLLLVLLAELVDAEASIEDARHLSNKIICG